MCNLPYTLGCAVRLGIAVSSCGVLGAQPSSSPIASGSISVDAVPVMLNPENPSQVSIVDFTYAGGLALTSRETDQLHGLSDLEVTDTNRLTAVSDLGVFLDARLVLDGKGWLVGLTDARLTPLTGEDGKPLSARDDQDAEGLALFPNGDRLVSFERRARIWLYPADGGPPRQVPMPVASFPRNRGMEALALDPETGANAYIVGSEAGGETWNCNLHQEACIKGPSVEEPGGFRLVAIRCLPHGRIAYLLRAFDAVRGNRNSLQIFQSGKQVARMDLVRPMTVDNFEGLAVVPGADGAVRFYLVSDDNKSASQRTILLAFDWQAK